MLDFKLASNKALATISSWCPGYWSCKIVGQERKILSPLRADKHIGSFSINEQTGDWYDFSTLEGGDTLSLYARVHNLRPGQAAAKLLGKEYREDMDDDYAIYRDPELRSRLAAGIHDPALQKEYLAITEPPVKKGPWPLTRYCDMTLTPPKWLIKGLLEDQSLALIFGASGHGKSYVAIDMAACIATGLDYHGRLTKVQGAVIYVAGEGYKGIGRRIKAWSLKNDHSLAGVPLYISHKACALRDPTLMAHVRSEINAVVASGEKVALIVLDTWARNMDGNENDTQETGEAIREIDNLRQEYECTALIIHHSGQAESERGRGSSALRAALDIEYKCEIKDHILSLKNTKMKDGEAPPELTFAFEPVDLGMIDDDGDPTISATLTEIHVEDLVGGAKKPRGAVQTKIIETLKMAPEGMTKAALKEVCAASGVQDRVFYNTIKRLVSGGQIRDSGSALCLV